MPVFRTIRVSEESFVCFAKVTEYVFPVGPTPVMTVWPPLLTVIFCWSPARSTTKSQARPKARRSRSAIRGQALGSRGVHSKESRAGGDDAEHAFDKDAWIERARAEHVDGVFVRIRPLASEDLCLYHAPGQIQRFLCATGFE